MVWLLVWIGLQLDYRWQPAMSCLVSTIIAPLTIFLCVDNKNLKMYSLTDREILTAFFLCHLHHIV